MTDVQTLAAAVVMIIVKDGDEIGWAEEFQWLWTVHRTEMLELMDSVLCDGFREPILVGNDGRLWDGHHRLAVALALHLPFPVEFAPENPDSDAGVGRVVDGPAEEDQK
jgi:hypothetical protein